MLGRYEKTTGVVFNLGIAESEVSLKLNAVSSEMSSSLRFGVNSRPDVLARSLQRLNFSEGFAPLGEAVVTNKKCVHAVLLIEG